MKPCPLCNGTVRLGATRVTVNRKRGVAHYIEHHDRNTNVCEGTKGWSVVMFKPYPKTDAPYIEMMRRWEERDIEDLSREVARLSLLTRRSE